MPLHAEVIVYRDEAFYFAHMSGWQRGLASPLTTKHWDRRSRSELAFAADSVVEEFWRNLDAQRLDEHFSIEVDTSGRTDTLIENAVNIAQSAASGKRYSGEALEGLYHLESGARIEPGHGIDEFRIEEGDHLGLILEHEPQAFYSLIPLPNSEAVFAAIRSANGMPPDVDTNGVAGYLADGGQSNPRAAPLLGALLYTDEDHEIATYTRKHFASLSEASGPTLQLYVVEQPEENWREASRYWKGILDQQLQREWSVLGWLRNKPYTATEAYKIARRLGVYPDQLPCLVLFDKPDDPRKLVFPILDGGAKFYRSLFGNLQRLIVPGQDAELSLAGIRDDFDQIVERVSRNVATGDYSDRAIYRFEGQTVFINRPAGDVSLSNFQNRTGQAQEEQR